MAKQETTPEERRLKNREKELRKQANALNRQLRQTQTMPKGKRAAQAELVDYIVSTYGIIYVPKSLSQKLVSISEGTYSGLTIKIPHEELLDMFRFFRPKLNKIKASQLSNGGEKKDPLSQFNYDLAIVLNGASEYYQKKTEAKEKLEKSIDETNYKLEKAIAGQDIARKKQRLAELEKEKNEREEVDLSELFKDF